MRCILAHLFDGLFELWSVLYHNVIRRIPFRIPGGFFRSPPPTAGESLVRRPDGKMWSQFLQSLSANAWHFQQILQLLKRAGFDDAVGRHLPRF